VWVLQLFGDRAVEVKSSAKFEAGVPKALFETRLGDARPGTPLIVDARRVTLAGGRYMVPIVGQIRRR